MGKYVNPHDIINNHNKNKAQWNRVDIFWGTFQYKYGTLPA